MPIYVKCKARDNQGKMRQIKLFLLTFCPSHQSEAGGCICLLMKESNRYVAESGGWSNSYQVSCESHH